MNKVILIGNLTRDPEVRATPSGVTICTFSVAVSRRFQNQSGERVTDYFNIIAWRQLGETCGRYLAKGRKVAVIGELQTRSYDAKDGSKRYVTEVVADEVEFLTPKTQDGAPYAPASYPASKEEGMEQAAEAPDGFTDVDDDELPF